MMSKQPENFLSRWTRVKQEAKQSSKDGMEPEDAKPDGHSLSQPPASPAAVSPTVPDHPAIDLSTLPPLESLTASSDFRPFLQAGVPEDLAREALRRLWRSDPSIGAYQLMADYAWDFNAPGYGALRAGEDVGKLLRQITDTDTPVSAPQVSSTEPVIAQEDATPKKEAHPPSAASIGDQSVKIAVNETKAVPVNFSSVEANDPAGAEPAPLPPRHGSARPKI